MGPGAVATPTALVRMTHVLQPPQAKQHYLKCLHALVDVVGPKGFHYQPAAAYPSDFDEWRVQNARKLAYCSADLPIGLSDRVLGRFNTPWDTGFGSDHAAGFPYWGHVCVRALCPFRCNNADGCKTTGKQLLTEMFDCTPDTPLIYRWKHFEPAHSYVCRGKLFFNVVRRALRLGNV